MELPRSPQKRSLLRREAGTSQPRPPSLRRRRNPGGDRASRGDGTPEETEPPEGTEPREETEPPEETELSQATAPPEETQSPESSGPPKEPKPDGNGGGEEPGGNGGEEEPGGNGGEKPGTNPAPVPRAGMRAQTTIQNCGSSPIWQTAC